jgi:DNA-binding transcriptional MocR family regulator
LLALLEDALKDSAQKPRYQLIAEAIGNGIRAGKLAPGFRLPPQRDLADRLKVTIGTITRAYSEVEQWGLIRGEVGRGTYVREPEAVGMQFGYRGETDGSEIDLSINTPPVASAVEEYTLYSNTFRELAQNPGLVELMHYQTVHNASAHRPAALRFLEMCGVTASPDEVLLCSGSQHAILVSLGALLRPGDGVLMEDLTYPGAKTVAALLNLHMHGLPMDDEGILPEAMEAACRQFQPRALYTVPNIQNPTTATMSLKRRQQIVEIARRYKLLIVEDDINALLPEEELPTLTALYPENTIYIANLSKSVAPALRISYMKSPSEYVERLINVIQTSVWMVSPLGAQIATDWVNSGQAQRMFSFRRQEAARRQMIAAARLRNFDFRANPYGLHLWLKLPEPWRAEDFVVQAQRRGVRVASAGVFAVGRTPAPDAVRISLSAPTDIGRMEKGLDILADILESSPAVRMGAL